MPKIDIKNIYAQSEDVVSREIEGELILIPVAAGIGDMEDELFTLNETGTAIWTSLDGAKSLEKIIASLVDEYEASFNEIQLDTLGLMQELYNRKMVVEIE